MQTSTFCIYFGYRIVYPGSGILVRRFLQSLNMLWLLWISNKSWIQLPNSNQRSHGTRNKIKMPASTFFYLDVEYETSGIIKLPLLFLYNSHLSKRRLITGTLWLIVPSSSIFINCRHFALSCVGPDFFNIDFVHMKASIVLLRHYNQFSWCAWEFILWISPLLLNSVEVTMQENGI